jgi:Polyketide cyclase / dehydrase and lipid transport
MPDNSYATVRVETVINMKADDFFSWYLHEPIENFMLGTLIVPPITGTEPLPGPAWGEPGASRRIFFKDGTTSLERILETDLPRSYIYQPWAYTSPVRLLSDYAVSTMRAEPEDGKTRIIWDYGFHARNGIARPVLQLFVTFDWKRNLANGLKMLKTHLETHGTARRMREG